MVQGRACYSQHDGIDISEEKKRLTFHIFNHLKSHG